MASGKTITCMAMVGFTTRTTDLRTKGNGSLTSFMAAARSSTTNLPLSSGSSITPISITWMKNGSITKEI